MARLMSRILLHLRNSETIRHPRGFAYQVARLRKSEYMWGGGLFGGYWVVLASFKHTTLPFLRYTERRNIAALKHPFKAKF